MFEVRRFSGREIYVFIIYVFIITPVGEDLGPKTPTVVVISTVLPDVFSFRLPSSWWGNTS